MLVFLKVWLVGAICSSGIFEVWSKFDARIFPKVKQIGLRVPEGRPKWIRGVPTPEAPENQVAKNGLPHESFKQWSNRGDICQCFSESFVGSVLSFVSVILVSNLASIL